MIRRILRLTVSFLYWVCRSMWVSARGRAKRASGTCVVLYYHAVRDGDRRRFLWQIEKILSLARPICLSQDVCLDQGVHHVAVTFDDGFQSVARNAISVLRERGVPVVVFVTTGFMGKKPGWNFDCGFRDANEVLMNSEELRTVTSGLVSIGSHSISHARLSQLDEKSARNELVVSKRTLEEITGKPVRLLSFPYGDHSEALVKWAREAGYRKVCTSSPALLSTVDHEVIGRVSVDPSDWRLEFQLKVLGAYSWLPGASRIKRRLSRVWSRRRITAGKRIPA
jgi:peptidoglycan/xylan/chitin deacetylase (PgdA/CDA1 family)